MTQSKSRQQLCRFQLDQRWPFQSLEPSQLLWTSAVPSSGVSLRLTVEEWGCPHQQLFTLLHSFSILSLISDLKLVGQDVSPSGIPPLCCRLYFTCIGSLMAPLAASKGTFWEWASVILRETWFFWPLSDSSLLKIMSTPGQDRTLPGVELDPEADWNAALTKNVARLTLLTSQWIFTTTNIPNFSIHMASKVPINIVGLSLFFSWPHSSGEKHNYQIVWKNLSTNKSCLLSNWNTLPPRQDLYNNIIKEVFNSMTRIIGWTLIALVQTHHKCRVWNNSRLFQVLYGNLLSDSRRRRKRSLVEVNQSAEENVIEAVRRSLQKGEKDGW